ncbi:uncharacterized protein LOC111603229 [Drosophila hydei]|uniref:Uncharacterized protein LOC111603229 n=1 Tax=Drosophila hydei TaxID=7224 RepID=A0A6J1MHF6_DROHY|nr:uncharacterized protein LOC111603229 [Drosophila hydei]
MSADVQNTDTKDTLTQLLEMGYAEIEARQALAHASNNLELAIQYLVGDYDAEQTDEALRRRVRRHCKQLRSCLMDNPALTDYAVAALMKKPRTAEALRELVGTHSVTFMESMLESSSDEEEVKEERNQSHS